MDAKTLYPNAMSYGYFGVYDYEPIVNGFGKVILQAETDGEQGDTWVLYQDGERFGYLEFGWGSCSGCDALQGCSNYDEVDVLISELKASFKWFEDAQSALTWFNEHDWEGSWLWNDENGEKFVLDARKMLQDFVNK